MVGAHLASNELGPHILNVSVESEESSVGRARLWEQGEGGCEAFMEAVCSFAVREAIRQLGPWSS